VGRDRTPEPVSPELVLVDPELARRARAELPAAETRRPAPARVAAEPAPKKRASRTARLLRLAAALVIAGTLVSPAVTPLARNGTAPPPAAVVAGESPLARPAQQSPAPTRAEPRQRAAKATPATAPADKSTPAAAPAQKSTRAKRPAAKRRAAPPVARAPRTFVWVPVKGADAYEVQFFRGSRRVLLTRTSRPRLEVLTGRARGSGQRFVLTPGSYRWYVWPLFRSGSAVRRGDAVVQAKLVVPR
jgi:hypothetical protein